MTDHLYSGEISPDDPPDPPPDPRYPETKDGGDPGDHTNLEITVASTPYWPILFAAFAGGVIGGIVGAVL